MACPLNYCNDSMCPRKAACFAEKRLYQSRSINVQAKIIEQKKLDNNQEFKGEYLGVNSEGNAIIKTITGIVQARNITNGHIVPGRLVTGVIPYRGSLGIISDMPTS